MLVYIHMGLVVLGLTREKLRESEFVREVCVLSSREAVNERTRNRVRSRERVRENQDQFDCNNHRVLIINKIWIESVFACSSS